MHTTYTSIFILISIIIFSYYSTLTIHLLPARKTTTICSHISLDSSLSKFAPSICRLFWSPLLSFINTHAHKQIPLPGLKRVDSLVCNRNKFIDIECLLFQTIDLVIWDMPHNPEVSDDSHMAGESRRQGRLLQELPPGTFFM